MNGTSSKGFKNNMFLNMIMVRVRMNVPNSMSLLTIELVGYQDGERQGC